MNEPTVSICTIAMNRLHHVQQTLPANLKENEEPGVNFVLLDYNSKDGLEDYIQCNFQDEMSRGKLTYYKHNDAPNFDRCHSRNMAFKLQGEILCNVDADNYAGAGFGKFVKQTFIEKKNICLTGLENGWKHDASGKMCVNRNDFMEVTGYDENFDGYGFEDFDIVNRLQLKGCETFTINKSDYLRAISHERNDRLSNESFYKTLEAIYVHFIDPSTSELLYQFKDHTCTWGLIVNTFTKNCDNHESFIPKNARFLPQFELPQGWQGGSWSTRSGRLLLSYDDEIEVCNRSNRSGQEFFQSEQHAWYLVTDDKLKLEAISFFTEMKNREQMISNLSNHRIQVNKEFGKGIVYKNFNQHEPIEI